MAEVMHSVVIPLLLALLIAAAIVAVVALAVSLFKVARTVDEVRGRVDPLLTQVETLMGDLQPAVKRIDPLLEHVTLTVDAANLEILRVDQILEDVGEVTDVLGSTAKAIDAVSSAPLDLVTGIAGKMRGILAGSPSATKVKHGMKKPISDRVDDSARTALATPEDGAGGSSRVRGVPSKKKDAVIAGEKSPSSAYYSYTS